MGEWRPRWDNALLDATPASVEMTVKRKGEPPLVLAFVTGPAYP